MSETMTTVYLAYHEKGEYSDYCFDVVGVYSTVERGQAACQTHLAGTNADYQRPAGRHFVLHDWVLTEDATGCSWAAQVTDPDYSYHDDESYTVRAMVLDA